METRETKTGFFVVAKPGEDCDIVNYEWKGWSNKDEKNSSERELIGDIAKFVTGDIKGKVRNMGYMPQPINFSTAFVNYDQFSEEAKYNVALFGNPLFGSILFMGVDLESEGGDIILFNEEQANEIAGFINNFKHFERDAGIYKMMSETDKNEFLKKFIEEQTNVIDETVNNSTPEVDEEISKAHEELEKMRKENPEAVERAERELNNEVTEEEAFS